MLTKAGTGMLVPVLARVARAPSPAKWKKNKSEFHSPSVTLDLAPKSNLVSSFAMQEVCSQLWDGKAKSNSFISRILTSNSL
ncbi:MAG TPA: hypothetical protein VI386_04450, partial [Candidatus Sulfotelmatobacter sp.]